VLKSKNGPINKKNNNKAANFKSSKKEVVKAVSCPRFRNMDEAPNGSKPVRSIRQAPVASVVWNTTTGVGHCGGAGPESLHLHSLAPIGLGAGDTSGWLSTEQALST
jgi:hypothetical protein